MSNLGGTFLVGHFIESLVQSCKQIFRFIVRTCNIMTNQENAEHVWGINRAIVYIKTEEKKQFINV